MHDAGQIAIDPQGEYDASVTYPRLSCVRYLNGVYLAKQETTGHAPAVEDDNEYWMFMVKNVSGADYVTRTDYATTDSAGVVKPDGITLTINENGILSGHMGVEKHIILYANQWSNSIYSISDSDILPTSNGIITMSDENNAEAIATLSAAVINIHAQRNGVLELIAMGTVPTIDLDITLILF